jgi:transcriptional regulator of acetoin/glycerol metabolism
VRHAIDAEKGNLSAAARRLGVARSTLYRKLKKRGAGTCGGAA